MMDAKSRYSNGRITRHITCTSEVEEREPCACRRFRRPAHALFIHCLSTARPLFVHCSLYCLSTIHPRANSARAERLVALIGLALRAKMGKKPAKSDVAERESKREWSGRLARRSLERAKSCCDSCYWLNSMMFNKYL